MGVHSTTFNRSYLMYLLKSMADSTFDVPPKVTEKKVVKPKKVIKKVVPTHPKYIDMIVDTLAKLKDRKGTSRMSLLKYIVENYKVNNDVAKVRVSLKLALTRGVAAGVLKMARETGKGSSSYKIGVLPKVKKPLAKKSTTKKATAKKPVMKKSTTKNVTTKKPVAKKAVPKKVAVKKPVAKNAVPKK